MQTTCSHCGRAKGRGARRFCSQACWHAALSESIDECNANREEIELRKVAMREAKRIAHRRFGEAIQTRERVAFIMREFGRQLRILEAAQAVKGIA